MNKPILVTFATRTASTAGVAEAIGQTLIEVGVPAEVRPTQEVIDLTPYGFWKEGDHRDWNAICTWAAALKSGLTA